jgi:hypothetical protein
MELAQLQDIDDSASVEREDQFPYGQEEKVERALLLKGAFEAF